MPVSISQYIGVEPELFAQTEALDAILDVDSKFFIDPHLLKSTQVPELHNSNEAKGVRIMAIAFSCVVH